MTGQRRASERARILDTLNPEEAAIVLWQLLANHPEAEEEAAELALSMLQGASFDSVADDVDDAVRSLGTEELYAGAGEHVWGYVGPIEAAWQVLEEKIQPFLDEIRRHAALGLNDEALEFAKGVVLGLYRVDVDGCEAVEHAPDFAAEYAGEAVDIWRKTRRSGGKVGQGGRSTRRTFPRDFVREHCPEWESMIMRSRRS
jgi:hypothetical protein